MSSITLDEVAEMTGGAVVGDGTKQIDGICAPADPSPGKLCVVWENGWLDRIPEEIAVLSNTGTLGGRDGVEVARPRAALAPLLSHFDTRRPSWDGVHPTAVVAGDCVMGEDVTIGPGCVISPRTVIEKGTVLQAQVFVGADVHIGERSRIESGAVLQDQVRIGNNVTIHSGAVIGSDGFGFVLDEDRKWVKIPQIGTVVIEDDVEIGAHTTIDRATFGVTRVRRGVKMGNMVHVAHNCDIGEDCLLVGYVVLGGSVTVGRSSLFAGLSAVADHVNVGESVTVAGRSGVTKDLPDGATVSGFPAQDHREELKLQASLRRAAVGLEKVRRLEREFEELRKR